MTAPRVWQRPQPTTASSDQTSRTASAGARVVKHHFVRSQLRHINTHGRAGLVGETIAALRRDIASFRDASDAEMLSMFEQMTERLQQRSLTINFEATSWFATPNTYQTYTQMYERAIRNFGAGAAGPVAHMVLKGDKQNPADVRENADDNATFGAHMKNADGTFKPDFEGIGRMMSARGLTRTGADAGGNAEFVANNPAFNPKAKQIFAALDYGRRPHGASTRYGLSVLLLKDTLMTNAIYFAGDTFFASDNAIALTRSLPREFVSQVSANDQISFDLLAGLYAKANAKLREALRAVFLGMPLGDTADADLLVEAHLFEPLVFRGGVERMLVVLRDATGAPLDKRMSAAVQKNATTFCDERNIKLQFSKA